MSQVQCSLSAILYVNDTDLLHLNMDTNESVQEVHIALQQAIENWGRLLIATGGSLKPEKCFFHLLDFARTQQGGWQYVAHHKDNTAAIYVPLPDGTMTAITHRAVDDSQKTLGVVTCPSRNSNGSLSQMKEKSQKWLGSLTAGRLHCRMMWISVDQQLWPLVWYGLCCSMATLPELELVLLAFYGKMLPVGGIVSKANRGIRQLDRGFYGAGFPHPGVEATAKQANKLLMHYGCHTALGMELQTSLELLVADLGLSFQPFRVNYEQYAAWVTLSWIKRVWEKIDHHGFILTVNNLLSSYPREGNNWLMSRFITMGYTAAELLILNRVQKHQQILFLLDIIGAGGGLADKQYLTKWPQGEQWSLMKFPQEVIIEPEMGLWHHAITQVVVHGPAQCSLGQFTTDGHKLWEWRVLENQGHLFRQHGDQVDIWSWQAGTIQTHPYQLLWQDARSGSHSGGGHAGHDESLFSGVSTHPPCSPGQFSRRTTWLGANVDMGRPQSDRRN